jgi:hypothetical protein
MKLKDVNNIQKENQLLTQARATFSGNSTLNKISNSKLGTKK